MAGLLNVELLLDVVVRVANGGIELEVVFLRVVRWPTSARRSVGTLALATLALVVVVGRSGSVRTESERLQDDGLSFLAGVRQLDLKERDEDGGGVGEGVRFDLGNLRLRGN